MYPFTRIVWCTSYVLIVSSTSSSIMDPGNIGVASFATIRIVLSISCRFAIHFFLSSLSFRHYHHRHFITSRSPSPSLKASWRRRREASGRSSKSGKADTSLCLVPSSPTKKLWVWNYTWFLWWHLIDSGKLMSIRFFCCRVGTRGWRSLWTWARFALWKWPGRVGATFPRPSRSSPTTGHSSWRPRTAPTRSSGCSASPWPRRTRRQVRSKVETSKASQ